MYFANYLCVIELNDNLFFGNNHLSQHLCSIWNFIPFIEFFNFHFLFLWLLRRGHVFFSRWWRCFGWLWFVRFHRSSRRSRWWLWLWTLRNFSENSNLYLNITEESLLFSTGRGADIISPVFAHIRWCHYVNNITHLLWRRSCRFWRVIFLLKCGWYLLCLYIRFLRLNLFWWIWFTTIAPWRKILQVSIKCQDDTCVIHLCSL